MKFIKLKSDYSLRRQIKMWNKQETLLNRLIDSFILAKVLLTAERKLMKNGHFAKLFLIDVNHYSKQNIVLRYASKMHRFFYKSHFVA